MNTNQVVQNLKESATKHKAFNAIVHDFALRKRARNIITMQALKQRMKEERFSFSDKEYAESLQILARMGLGTIELDPKGRVRALKDIKVKLQSIGKIACGVEEEIKGFRSRNKFKTLPDAPVNAPKGPQLESLATVVTITLDVQGQKVVLTVPKEMPNEEIADLIGRFK